MKPVEIKVVLIGNTNVGKSSILIRFVTDTFEEESDPTVGACFMSKQVTTEGKVFKYNIWDTAGQERFETLAKMYYRDTSVAILVYDITNRNSFEALDHWAKEIIEFGPENIMKVVVGNKEDLVEEEEVSEEEAEKFGFEIGAWTTRTSAKASEGIFEIFQEIARKSCETKPKARDTIVLSRVKENENIQKKKKNCC